VPLSEDKKASRPRHSREGGKKSSASSQKNGKYDVYEDNPLPWNIKESKNFYEVYAKENDRRRKEGTFFSLALEGFSVQG
jgi:hypothetical protein